MTGVVNIAYCPDHGLHGAREHCFICEKPVELVSMIRLSDHQQLRDAACELLEQINHMPGIHNPTWPVGAAVAKIKELTECG